MEESNQNRESALEFNASDLIPSETEEQRQQRLDDASFHEAGHAVAAVKLGVHFKSVKINLTGRGSGNGLYRDFGDRFEARSRRKDRKKIDNVGIVLICGQLAQESMTRRMLFMSGVDDQVELHLTGYFLFDGQRAPMLAWIMGLYNCAAQFIIDNHPTIALVARRLRESGELSCDEVTQIVTVCNSE